MLALKVVVIVSVSLAMFMAKSAGLFNLNNS